MFKKIKKSNRSLVKKSLAQKLILLFSLGGAFICFAHSVYAGITPKRAAKLESVKARIVDFQRQTLQARASGDPLKPAGVEITPEEIANIARRATKALKNDPTLLKIQLDSSDTLDVFSDFHGDLHSAVCFLENALHQQGHKVLLLGDYIDRGSNSLETLVYVYLNKILYPNAVFMLRGNHEVSPLNPLPGSMVQKIASTPGLTSAMAWKEVGDLYAPMDFLPLAAVIINHDQSRKLFAVHAGIVPHLTLPEIAQIERPPLAIDKPKSLPAKLVWNDVRRTNCDGKLHHNPSRGGGYTFDEKITTDFLTSNGVIGIIRGHQKANGDEILPTPFVDFRGKLVTINSASIRELGVRADGVSISGANLNPTFFRLATDFRSVSVVNHPDTVASVEIHEEYEPSIPANRRHIRPIRHSRSADGQPFDLNPNSSTPIRENQPQPQPARRSALKPLAIIPTNSDDNDSESDLTPVKVKSDSEKSATDQTVATDLSKLDCSTDQVTETWPALPELDFDPAARTGIAKTITIDFNQYQDEDDSEQAEAPQQLDSAQLNPEEFSDQAEPKATNNDQQEPQKVEEALVPPTTDLTKKAE